jgi:Flp pilus assembly protein TadD
MDISAKLKHGVSQQQAGELAQAAKIYQQILTKNPTQFDALRLLGMIYA